MAGLKVPAMDEVVLRLEKLLFPSIAGVCQCSRRIAHVLLPQN